ncbi:MAG: YicC family protein [Deltaproteobacteria bacterium]|nr:YicC family protein [Deltaproteobacteria bacterium]
MISSMTAYARAEKMVNELKVLVEIRSYNSKYLDISLRVPHGYDSIESKIKEMISGSIARGRLEIKLHIKDEDEKAFAFEIDKSKAIAYHKALLDLNDLLNLKKDVPLEFVADSVGIIRPAETEKDLDVQWPVIQDCFHEAIETLKKMRQKEGTFLEKDFHKRLDFIEKSISKIEKESGDLLAHYMERLEERIRALTKGITEIDTGRIAQEAAFLADRSDISEEIVRAKSHITQFREILTEEESSGRKLNFLLQEFNREFNTMGAKAGNTKVSHTIVSVKSELEKIREQVQNVE